MYNELTMAILQLFARIELLISTSELIQLTVIADRILLTND